MSSPLNPIADVNAPLTPSPPSAPPVSSGAPVENPAWTGWDVLRIFVLGMAGLFASLILLLLVAHGSSLKQRAEYLGTKPELLLIAQMVVYLGILGYMYVVVTRERGQKDFWQSIRWNWPANIWPYLAIGVVLQIVFLVVARYLPFPENTPFHTLLSRPSTLVIIAGFSVTLGPLMEELFFRGFLYPVLARRVGIAAGVLITAVGFALMHASQYGYSWASLLLICVVGLVLGTVRARQGSLGAAFLVHTAYNGTIMFLLGALTGGFRHLDRLNQ